MKEQQARAVLLVKALETASSGDTCLSPAQREAATAAARAAVPRPASEARRLEWTEAFIVRRAERLWLDALARQPRLQALQGDAWLMTLLRWGLPLVGLLAGLAAELWSSPQAINLLSPALSLFVLWNAAVFVGLGLWALRRSWAASGRSAWLGEGLARLAWPRAWSRPLWAVARSFQRDWMRLAGPATGARVSASLHLSAALCAVGMVAALLFKGLFAEYRVGWQSQWLDARQMHALFATVGQWLGAAPIALDDLVRLEGGAGAVKADGSTWAVWWSRLLLLGVAAPRLVLAGLALWRARRLLGGLHLDLSDPYFVRLLADHGGPATTALVLPYSYRLTPAAERGLAAAVRQRFGPAATPVLHAPVGYGEAAPPWPDAPRGTQRQGVVLFSLAATPEQETHGAFVRQVTARAAVPVEVWLDSSPFSTHLAGGARAARLAEREALWRDFLGTAPVRVWHLETVETAHEHA